MKEKETKTHTHTTTHTHTLIRIHICIRCTAFVFLYPIVLMFDAAGRTKLCGQPKLLQCNLKNIFFFFFQKIGLVLSTRLTLQLSVNVQDVSFNSRAKPFSNMFVPIAYFKIVRPSPLLLLSFIIT